MARAARKAGARKASSAPEATAGGSARPAADSRADRARLDVWLWRARFHRSRAGAAEAVTKGGVRVNGRRVQKPGHGVKTGDVLTFARRAGVTVLEIRALGVRRGPASEAVGLYRVIEPETDPSASSPRATTSADVTPADVSPLDIDRSAEATAPRAQERRDGAA